MIKLAEGFQGESSNTIRFAVGQCCLGGILVAATNKGICAVFLGDDRDELLRDLQHRFGQAEIICGDQDFQPVVDQVICFVDSPSMDCQLPLDLRGTAFQRSVWNALADIPYGETASYSDIAHQIGKPKSVRAVAGACGANPVSVLIPCHRVVRTDGGLSGYRWGVQRKAELLERERKTDSVTCSA